MLRTTFSIRACAVEVSFRDMYRILLIESCYAVKFWEHP